MFLGMKSPILAVSLLMLAPVFSWATTVASRPVLANTRCFVDPATGTLAAKKFAARSATFRKAAEQAWRATHNGDAAFEAGFSIDREGQPGKVQLSLFETVNAATHLNIASNASALGTLHVHNRFGKSTPSPEDVQSARTWRQTIYVESRTGLYAIGPDGRVCHLFSDVDWFNKRCGQFSLQHASAKPPSSSGLNQGSRIP